MRNIISKLMTILIIFILYAAGISSHFLYFDFNNLNYFQALIFKGLHLGSVLSITYVMFKIKYHSQSNISDAFYKRNLSFMGFINTLFFVFSMFLLGFSMGLGCGVNCGNENNMRYIYFIMSSFFLLYLFFFLFVTIIYKQMNKSVNLVKIMAFQLFPWALIPLLYLAIYMH